jgi:hypothetical protein
MSKGWWELIFLMFLMKLPIAYLIAVVWWAVRAEPRPEEGAAKLAVLDPDPPPSSVTRFRSRPRHPRSGPHGAPVRRPQRVASASARAEGRPRP